MSTTTNTQSGLVIAKIVILSKLEADKNGELPVKIEPILGKYIQKNILSGTVFNNMAESTPKLVPNSIALFKWEELPHKNEEEQEKHGNAVRYVPLQILEDDILDVILKYQDKFGMAVKIPMLNPGPEEK